MESTDVAERQESEGKKQTVKKIIQLTEIPLGVFSCVGYHGTSIESIDYILQHGKLPGTTYDTYPGQEDNPQEGDIYFVPSGNFPVRRLPELEDVADDILGRTSVSKYAWTVALGHGFCSKLNISIENCARAYSFIDALKNYGDKFRAKEEEYVFFQNISGRSREEIDVAVEVALQRKGVILGLDKKALSKFRFSYGDQGDDFRVSTNIEGLALKYLSSIKPLGEVERKYFEDLKRKYNIMS